MREFSMEGANGDDCVVIHHGRDFVNIG